MNKIKSISLMILISGNNDFGYSWDSNGWKTTDKCPLTALAWRPGLLPFVEAAGTTGTILKNPGKSQEISFPIKLFEYLTFLYHNL